MSTVLITRYVLSLRMKARERPPKLPSHPQGLKLKAMWSQDYSVLVLEKGMKGYACTLRASARHARNVRQIPVKSI